MSLLDEAVTKYNKLLESGPYRDLSWAEALHQRMENEKLSAGGRLICPFLRPNFITRRQYDSLVKTSESLIGAIDRMEQIVLSSPALLSRLELLPAEKMLAAIDPGYQPPEAASRLATHLVNGHLQTIEIKNLIGFIGRVLKRHVVLETGAASADDGNSQRHRDRILHAHDFLDLGAGSGSQTNHKFLWPPHRR